ncbi:MAG: NAD-dependent epimerase/dehydratase family protein, partial [Pyrinomonadaceae bacterium]|nr:NAD-dependent epimerase/dehydratase family protein [Pyrinomonadaceae bacterium]
MKILIIGGTRFVGRHLTESATSKGHELTVFHRGSTPSNGLPPMTEILGDRTSDIDKLSQGSWDAVIDTCGYHPAHVESMARALSGLTAQYVYISSISAYADFSTPNFGEDAPLTRLDPTQQETFQNLDPNRNHDAMGLGDLYGPLKAMCEDTVTRVFGNESLIVRAGLIVGKYDWTDRFTYWVMRTANGGKVLAPFGPEAPVQIIDARDLADWIVKMIENRGTGVFNVAGVPGMTDFGIMLNCAREVTGSDAEFVWADDQFMADHD